MAIFGSSNESYLGVDLSRDSIKIVELKNDNNKPRLVTYGYTEVKTDDLGGHFIENKNATSATLKEVCQRSKTTTTTALAALPIANVFTSVISLHDLTKKDLTNDEKIKSLLTVEAKKILPLPIEQMLFDYSMVNNSDIDKKAETDRIESTKFLITATANDIVKAYADIFQQAGLKLTNLDIEPFALVKSLIGNDKSLIMLLDIGENMTSLSVIDDGIPIMNRTILVGSKAVSKQIADSLKISFAEAEQYKIDLEVALSQQNLPDLPQPVKTALIPIISEIKYLIKMYSEQVSNQKSIDKVILTGGGAVLALLPEYLSKTLDLRVYLGDPWARIIYPQELTGMLKQIGPRFSVAVGLAMREII